MKKKLLTVVLMWAVSGICCTAAFAGGESEHQRAKTAEKLVSSNPKSFKYNYYYGICLLISGKDKTQALPYLEAAMQNPKTPEDIYYYMGRALHYTYRFDESLRSFAEFNNIIGAKNASRWNIHQLMQMCNNAKQILDTAKLSQITERNESPAYNFYSLYAFNAPNGKLLSMPDEIIQSSKSEKDERPTIFLSANGRVMYYSAFNPENNSRDIYRVEKDLEGSWMAPSRLDNLVNTNQDELFPSCNNDGRILYFSSRGHNSTGGFDLFKCYYSTVSKTWTKPENMGSPYNSPDDDFCFVASTEEQAAYFTSQRETGPGRFTVYKVKYANTEELPIAINGKFNCIGQPGLKSVRVVVSRDGAENIVADVMSDSATGTYSLELPGPGTYAFRVEAPGFQPVTEEVRFGEFSDRIYVQDIFLSRSLNGMEDMAIANRRLTESGLIDESLTAEAGMEDDMMVGLSEADREALKISRMTRQAQGVSYDADGNQIPIGENGSGIAGQTIGKDKSTKDGKAGTTNEFSMMSANGIVFKVQIGAFRKHTRDIVQKRLEKKTDKTMLTSYDDLSWLRFFMGGEFNYSSAKNLRETLRQAGFEDAFIVAFKNSKPMNLLEAIKSATTASN
jgi:hypothetical protein